MAFLDEMQAIQTKDLQKLEVDGLPPFWVGPLTIKQAQEIDAEEDAMVRLAKHFFVRAKTEEGKPVMRPIDFDRFCKEADLNAVSQAVVEMTQLDPSAEDMEKN